MSFWFSCFFIYLRAFNYLKSFPVPAKADTLNSQMRNGTVLVPWHGSSSTEVLLVESKWTIAVAGVKQDLTQQWLCSGSHITERGWIAGLFLWILSCFTKVENSGFVHDWKEGWELISSHHCRQLILEKKSSCQQGRSEYMSQRRHFQCFSVFL